jgi:hypothetical protein
VKVDYCLENMFFEPDVTIPELDWHAFDQFSCLGDLASLLHLDSESDHSASLKMLSSITACSSKRRKERPVHSLHVFVAFGLPNKQCSQVLIDNKTLDDFYKRFFDSSVTSPFMRKFFRDNVTLMVARRKYYKPTDYHLELVGALTFSRPRDKLPTYLAYMAVSDGLNQTPSLANSGRVHILPKGAFPDDNPHVGYQGLGLGAFMLRLMEWLVISSIQRGHGTTRARIPLPECYLHYNNNNSKSADGWVKQGFVPVFDEAVPVEESAPLQKRYQLLADSLAACHIFTASHGDETNCTTMVTKFAFPKAHPGVPADEIPPWFASYEPDLEPKFIATKPSFPYYMLDEEEVLAKYTDPDSTPRPLRCSEILEMAYARFKFCSGMKNYSEGRADEDLHEDTDMLSSSSSSSSSSLLLSSSSSSSDNGNVPADEKKMKAKSKKKKRIKKQRKKKAKKKLKSRRTKRRRNKNIPTQESRLDTKFTDQEFIDFACLQDPERSIQVDPYSLVQIGREKLLTVHVDSFNLGGGFTLNDARESNIYLTRCSNPIRCSWEWLRQEVVPEVASLLEERIFGLPIVEGIGLDHVDTDVARRDVDTMAAFHGTYSRASGFVSPPLSHVRAKLPVDEFGAKEYGRKDSHVDPMEEMRKHRTKSLQFAEHVKTLKIKAEPPPLPRSRYQISRLKWIPTEEEGADMLAIGYFQGAYNVPNTSHFSVVSLRDEWVFHYFDDSFIQEVKEQAVGGTRSSRKLVVIPPGDSKPEDYQQPAPYLMMYMRRAKFQQNENSTCLVDSFCSAMHEFGCPQVVANLRQQEEKVALSAGNKNIWGDFANLVNRNFKPLGLQLFREKAFSSIEEFLNCDDSFVIIASLKANDGSGGQHAVAIFDGAIYDANCRFALQKGQESLDWCCGGDGVVCTGYERAYKLLPINHRNVRQDSRYSFQKEKGSGRLVRGWIVSHRPVSTLIQFVDGEKKEATPFELAIFRDAAPS